MKNQGDFFPGWDPGEHVHRSDEGETSSDAAEVARRSAGPQMRMVFEYLLERGRTHDELRTETGLGDNAAKRCSDLKNAHWIEDSGERRDSDRGQPAVVWTVTEYGCKRYSALTGKPSKKPSTGNGVDIQITL
jgi:hypothetical protein